MKKFERRFASWEEYEQEFETNLKNFGMFLPEVSSVAMREKIELQIWLPGAGTPVPAKAEVVAIFPDGSALSLESGTEVIRILKEKEQELKAEPIKAMNQGREEETEPVPEKALESNQELEEDEEEIEKKLGFSSLDYSNLFQAVRRLSKLERIALAKRGNRKALSILIQEGDRTLFRFIIQNPHLSTVEVLQLLKHPSLPMDIIQELVRNSSWLQNEEVRFQIVIHPKTPLPTALGLLPGLNQRQLGQISKSKHIKYQIKNSALKLLIQRQSGQDS